jgi:hypothetical protein
MEVPKVIVTLILSFCELGDILSIKLTCRYWNSLTESLAFWKHHVQTAMERVLSIVPPEDRKRVDLSSFNNFIFKELSWRESCEWLFQKSAWRVVRYSNGISIVRSHCHSHFVWMFLDTSMSEAQHFHSSFEKITQNHDWTSDETLTLKNDIDNRSSFVHSFRQSENGILEWFERATSSFEIHSFGPIYYSCFRRTDGSCSYKGEGIRINWASKKFGIEICDDGERIERKIRKRN